MLITSTFSLGDQGDYALFVSGTLIVLMGIQRLFLGRLRRYLLTWFVWFIALLTVVCGWFHVDRVGKDEQRRYISTLEGFAPTFAHEMERLGHEKINLSTPPDDPGYLALIEAQKQWLLLNPDVQNIYTFRMGDDGKSAQLIVDSETDYDHNNRYEGEKEERAAVGKVFEADKSMMRKALAGKISFSERVITDERGSWIIFYCPIRNSGNFVEAVLGLDFDSTEWLAARSYTRWNAIGYISIILFGVLALAAGLAAWMLVKQNAEQCQISAALEQQRGKLETLVNSIDGVVMEWDPAQDLYVFVSKQAQELLGYSEETWKNEKGFWLRHVFPEDLEFARATRGKAFATREECDFEYRLKSSDGRIVWVRERGAVIQERGHPPLLRGVMTDITAQKESGEELERLNKQLITTSRHAGMAEVASGVLHNVGNVLNSVNVSSTIISDTLSMTKLPMLKRIGELLAIQNGNLPQFFASDPRGLALPRLLPELHRELENENQKLIAEVHLLVKNISHIKQIIVMQQDFAKSGGNAEEFSLDELMDDAIRINESSLARQGIEIVRDYEPTPPVIADRNRVLQVVVNLVGNARHAVTSSGKEGKVITLGLASEGGNMVKISVQDNGIGIPPERLPLIFSYGFTTKKDGHGFGLHSCAKAAREMGGSLSVNSEGPGRGATFTLDLPVVLTEPILAL